MTLEFFRKPYLAFFLSAIMMFAACSSDDSVNHGLSAEQLRLLHDSIKSEAASSTAKKDTKPTEEMYKEAERLYFENAEFLNENGVKDMLIANNIDPIILEQFEFYQENYDNKDVYQLLMDKYNFSSKADAELLFTFIEVYNHTVDQLGLEATTSRISFSCALAITATVVATASAVTIAAGTAGAGTALAFWVVGKAIATVGVIDSCT